MALEQLDHRKLGLGAKVDIKRIIVVENCGVALAQFGWVNDR
jgi:hypothetical protein